MYIKEQQNIFHYIMTINLLESCNKLNPQSTVHSEQDSTSTEINEHTLNIMQFKGSKEKRVLRYKLKVTLVLSCWAYSNRAVAI